jgi:IclR family transcriptional regulator, KDG regulon repressor
LNSSLHSFSNQMDRKIIGSVQKAIDILNLFDAQNPELGTTEIAVTLEMPKSTAAGLVHTLKVNGCLEQNPQNRKYRLGFKLVELSTRLLNQIGLRQAALPHLRMLRDWCNEGVNLAVQDGGEVIYIERLFGTGILGMRSEIGKREPAHSTALGKAILSRSSDTEIKNFIDRCGLPAITPHTLTERARFIADLQLTRERGFALDNEENELGGRCVAAPIMDYARRVAAAVSISAPVQRLPDSQIALYGAKVKETAAMISRQLGYFEDV